MDIIGTWKPANPDQETSRFESLQQLHRTKYLNGFDYGAQRVQRAVVDELELIGSCIVWGLGNSDTIWYSGYADAFLSAYGY